MPRFYARKPKPKLAARRIRIRPPVKERFPTFRAKAKVGSFRFTRTEEWKYSDALPTSRVSNYLVPYESNIPHLVLWDRHKPRWVAAYRVDAIGLYISSIQRVRTEYSSAPGAAKMKWDARRETRNAKQFAQDLGMHPAEFLLCELLTRYKKIARKNRFMLHFEDNDLSHKIYRPLVERYFAAVPYNRFRVSDRDHLYYALDLTRPRVKKLLDLK